MLPRPGDFQLLWEVCSSAGTEGKTIRTVGRLSSYHARISEAILIMHHNSTLYQLAVYTALVEPFEAHLGSDYMVLGEIEATEGNIPVIQARLLMCVDGINLPLLERAIQEQRKYFQERDGRSDLETEEVK
uniref:CST complex subunit TEN1 n=1 Tax=Callorhinchus milii TaxID=7868 RepID=A0A4W3JC15_CALMI